MKIRLKYAVTGTFHNMDGLRYGDVVEIDDGDAERYIRQGFAEAVADKPAAEKPVQEHAVATSDTEEHAVPPATRGRGRPPKTE